MQRHFVLHDRACTCITIMQTVGSRIFVMSATFVDLIILRQLPAHSET